MIKARIEEARYHIWNTFVKPYSRTIISPVATAPEMIKRMILCNEALI